ncbi:MULTISPECIES: hypothetical protein [Dyella]|uniref:Uncharacterized protein n=2 Tax=Dyella TaxID=231454 RepID=A0A4R0YRN0_9GAMM|nr:MULTISPECIES: hypothetical protein [Dyella]TBR40576.1 hypothetical protein EYV96_10605 [Dyella terrae]TCI11842.1 hypothetical protein EZM97_00265 [Dyella soli]
MRKLVTCGLVGAAMWIAVAAEAQTAPGDVSDLVGARAAGGETQLTARGYVNVGGSEGDGRKWTYWWNERHGTCLSVTTKDGRYASILATPPTDCQNGPRSQSDGPADAGGHADHLSLICYGKGQHQTSQSKSGYEWDDDKHKYVPRSGMEVTQQEFDTSMAVAIDGDQGRVRLAKDMVPAIHAGDDAGWFTLTNLSVSGDFIRGEFRINGLNHPKLTIDRRAGHIALEGLTKFSGTCNRTDSDRKF